MAIKLDGSTITLPKGDTGLLAVTITGVELTGSDRIVFAIKDSQTDETILIKNVVPINNVAGILFENEDTENIDPGTYKWDVRVVIDANIVKEEIIDGAEIHSAFAPERLPKFMLKEVAADV